MRIKPASRQKSPHPPKTQHRPVQAPVRPTLTSLKRPASPIATRCGVTRQKPASPPKQAYVVGDVNLPTVQNQYHRPWTFLTGRGLDGQGPLGRSQQRAGISPWRTTGGGETRNDRLSCRPRRAGRSRPQRRRAVWLPIGEWRGKPRFAKSFKRISTPPKRSLHGRPPRSSWTLSIRPCLAGFHKTPQVPYLHALLGGPRCRDLHPSRQGPLIPKSRRLDMSREDRPFTTLRSSSHGLSLRMLPRQARQRPGRRDRSRCRQH